MRKTSLILILSLISGFSCQRVNEQVITDEEAMVLLNRFMKTVTETDTTLAEELLHPDCVFHYPILPEPIKGIDGYKAFIKDLPDMFSEVNAVIEEVNVKGDRIWCRYSMTGINSGPLGDVPATGKEFQVTGMAITRVKEGKIIEDETYWNALGLYQQLGFTLSPPEMETEQ